MSGSGKGGGNRGNRWKPPKRRGKKNAQSQSHPPKNGEERVLNLSPIGEGRLEKKRGSLFERPKWTPPKQPPLAMPAATCAWCNKAIKDISSAISDPNSGEPIHFDCVINRIIENEILESGDMVSYIGGGRFGIIHFNNPPDTRDFMIKKIFEWENKENRSEWRLTISDHFSVT
jgi:hypothetical protein